MITAGMKPHFGAKRTLTVPNSGQISLTIAKMQRKTPLNKRNARLSWMKTSSSLTNGVLKQLFSLKPKEPPVVRHSQVTLAKALPSVLPLLLPRSSLLGNAVRRRKTMRTSIAPENDDTDWQT